MQTKLTVETIKPNENISFPVGTIFTVKKYFEKLGFPKVFSKYKKKGRNISSLIEALVSYKLTENFSISKASGWINRKNVLREFNLKDFHEKTLFRTLGIVGKNKEEIFAGVQDNLFSTYDFEHTDSNVDWTSLVIYGEMCKLAKHGYSKDHRPDKKQINIGISEISEPINVPIGITVSRGNVPDVKHFEETYNQIRERLKPGSRIVFDKGAKSDYNISLILSDKMKYLTSKKLNKSDDKRIKSFDKSKADLVDSENGIYGLKFAKPSKIDYFYFSERLEKTQIESKKRKARKMLEEAKEIQKSLDNNKTLPKRFQIKNKLVDVRYNYQTKLKELDEKRALEYVEKELITFREGFFCFSSNENLTLEEALSIYRKKDSIEKMIHSLKSEIEIKPLRVWTDDSIYGAILIGFLAQLFISLMRYDHEELKHVSTKFIKNSLMNLTVTLEIIGNKTERYVYANFDSINKTILAKWQEIT